MKRVSLFSVMFAVGWALFAQERAWAKDPEPSVQIAILLDTSGSMTGLIDPARYRQV